MDEAGELPTWAFLVRSAEDDELLPQEAGERLATFSVQMFYEVPSGYFTEGITRDELVLSDLGLWWRIRTMARTSWIPRGFVPWWTITGWLVRPRRRSRKDVEIHHVLHLDRPAILLVRAKADVVDALTETVRPLLPETCAVHEEQQGRN